MYDPLFDPLEMAPYEDPYIYDLPPPSRPHRCRELKIYFYTCGRSYRLSDGLGPRILSMSCADTTPPPPEMCLRFSGLDRELSDWLFSHREYRVKYTRALDRIADAVGAWQPSRDGPRFSAVIKCKAGVHRSVAMADKLAWEVSSWKVFEPP